MSYASSNTKTGVRYQLEIPKMFQNSRKTYGIHPNNKLRHIIIQQLVIHDKTSQKKKIKREAVRDP